MSSSWEDKDFDVHLVMYVMTNQNRPCFVRVNRRAEVQTQMFVGERSSRATVHLTWSALWVIEKNIDDILMRSKIPSLVEMKRFCAWKFVSSSYIGRDISGQNYLEDTILLN